MTDTLYRRKIVNTLEAFSSLCEREGFRWFMAFGSAIGAVRHGGIIPWDDDVDVYMPREDFNKLLAAKVPEGFEVLTYRTTPGLPFSYAKFSDTTSTIWEMKKYPFVTGTFVDVFPLDSVPSDKAQAYRKVFSKRLYAYKKGIRRTDFSSWAASGLHDKLVAIRDIFWYRPLKRLNMARLKTLEEKLSTQSGDKYIVYDNIYSDAKVLYDKELFSGVQVADFEGLKVPLPSGNDALLTQIYGDYMTPPPEDKRTSGHQSYYINVEERYSVGEVRKLKKEAAK